MSWDGLLQSWDYLCLSDIQDGGHSRTNMGPYWKMNTSFYLETPYMIEPKLCMNGNLMVPYDICMFYIIFIYFNLYYKLRKP
jgi:hypothetical protein